MAISGSRECNSISQRPGRILFGRGATKDLSTLAGSFGKRALFVTGRDPARAAGLISDLQQAGFDVACLAVPGEPTVDQVRAGARLAREKQCEIVIGFGGGSPIDAAKAIAAVATNSGEPMDYIEVVGRGLRLECAPLPFLAVPTTAGTGAEVTRNAVLGIPEHGLKASLRSASMLAKVAIVDPELTVGLSPQVTAYTGLDTLTQLIEPYVSSRSNPFTDALCIDGLKHVSSSLERTVSNGRDIAARESMSYAALLSGLALANAGLGAVHGFAAPLGGMLNASHGAICAAILPSAVFVNIQALRQRDPHHPALRKYAELAQLLTGHSEAEQLAPWLASLTARLGVASLGEHGLKEEQVPGLIGKASKASSMKANPVTLTPDELMQVVQRSL